MKKILFLVVLSLAGSLVVQQRQRLAQLPTNMMERGMAMMPEDSPPMVMMSSLRRMQEQNEQLVALVREQNDLLRERLPTQEA